MLKRLSIVFTTVLMYFIGNSQELPPIQNYTTADYHAENQNWAFSQSTSKKVYAANNKGLLEFNGARWKLYPTPNETVIRSVLAIQDTIYTGSYMEYGYWVRDTYGDLIYESLTKNDTTFIEDEQIWNIAQINSYVLFQSLNRIHIYDLKSKTFRIVASDKGIIKMYKVKDDIYYQKGDFGLFQLINGEEVEVKAASKLQDIRIINLFKVDNELIAITEGHGFLNFSAEEISTWNNITHNALENTIIYSAAQLHNGDFILGSISHGILVLNEKGKIIYSISQSTGLGDNTVLAIFEDADYNVWLGLDNGIDCINLTSPIRIYYDEEGVLGTIYSSIVYENSLYLGTNQGLFVRPLEAKGKLELIPNTQGQVWTLQEINGVLFCGHNNGTFIVKDASAKRISAELGTWLLKEIPNQPNLLIQGNYNGLNVLEYKNRTYTFRNKIEGFDISSRYFSFVNPQHVLVSHEYKGVFHVLLDEEYKSATQFYEDTTTVKASKSSLIKHQGEILYAYNKGVFKYDVDAERFTRDSIYSTLFNENNYTSGKLVSEKSTNTLWAFSQDNLSYANSGTLSRIPVFDKIELPSNLRNDLTGFENINHINNDTFLLGTSSGYLLIDTSRDYDKAVEIQLDEVNTSGINVETKRFPLNETPTFENKRNSVSFSYHVADYEKYLNTQYQYKLDGLNNIWSQWSTNTMQSFDNLSFGDYEFSVRGKVGDVLTENEETFSFTIKRPWYASNAMLLFYLAVFVVSLILIDGLYKRRRRRALLKSQQKLAIIELENKEQLMSFENENLQKDIQMKNKELAISTMSLIKKNEFLNEIKSELIKAEKSKNIAAVVKIIDKNINNTDDWKFFQEAFDNADKDFLKKIKSQHPSLTSNDLKLCAYLRLNLSSKEIAPLLNISPRSVEVKRYRLRKKMNLKREDSLTDYILSL